VQDAVLVAQAMRGAETVISVMGSTHNWPTFEISTGIAKTHQRSRTRGMLNRNRILGLLGA